MEKIDLQKVMLKTKLMCYPDKDVVSCHRIKLYEKTNQL